MTGITLTVDRNITTKSGLQASERHGMCLPSKSGSTVSVRWEELTEGSQKCGRSAVDLQTLTTHFAWCRLQTVSFSTQLMWLMP